jgi:hypothetical protein
MRKEGRDRLRLSLSVNFSVQDIGQWTHAIQALHRILELCGGEKIDTQVQCNRYLVAPMC